MRPQSHAPNKMSRAHNRVAALTAVTMGDLGKLDAAFIARKIAAQAEMLEQGLETA